MRTRLPARRPNQTTELDFGGTTYAITVGYRPDDGTPAELFVHGARVGSGMDAILDDVGVMVSLLLQHGVKPRDLARSLGSGSVIGAIVAELVV
jgi:hypothetical protein